jgi:hypothetical protein
MFILYINGWSFNNSLTIASTLPSLNVLIKSEIIHKIYVLTPETEKLKVLNSHHKIEHIPILVNKKSIFSYFINEFILIYEIYKIVKNKKIDKIIARGATSGGRASIINSILKVPYIVESFEPHSEYMLDSKVWKTYYLRYITQRLWEHKIKKTAEALITVSINYANQLKSEGVEIKRIYHTPCTVNITEFSKNINDRNLIRKKFGINDKDITGIYLGKFDDIYFSLKDSIFIFIQAFKNISNFHLILLTNTSHEDIFNAFIYAGYERFLDKVHIMNVAHNEVPQYLSASDFAYSLVKTGKSKKYCSPLKNGEYWANGLPIVIPEEIGDDSAIIINTKLGVIIKKEDNYSYIPRLLDILNNSEHKILCVSLAFKYRSRDLIIKTYKDIGLF